MKQTTDNPRSMTGAIKAGLHHCIVDNSCVGCPYLGDRANDCTGRLIKDALAYIEQLEAEQQSLIKVAAIHGELCNICKHSMKRNTPKGLCLGVSGRCVECDSICPCKDCRFSDCTKGYEWNGGA